VSSEMKDEGVKKRHRKEAADTTQECKLDTFVSMINKKLSIVLCFQVYKFRSFQQSSSVSSLLI